ncbi:vWA domain-containing protein [Streptomyces sp. NPDC127066]|uniref:vWA domain-containing protein n=1 Tax=Streptomyces sp. NPDC127066 TaxID=3347125 RepID=UPI00365951CA
MNTPSLSERTHRLFPARPGDGPLCGQRVGANPADLPPGITTTGTAALLVAGSGSEEVALPVRLVPLSEVPPGVLAVGDETAAEIDLEDSYAPARWRIEHPPLVPLNELQLESAGETGLDDAADALQRADLVGRLLWIPANESQELAIRADGTPYRVKHYDAGGHTAVLAEIQQRTATEVFVSGANTGVDMVVLADCSTSMLVPDIPADPGGSLGLSEDPSGYDHGFFARFRQNGKPVRKEERVEVLRRALRQLVAERRRLRGRTSRIALMEFTRTARQVFPHGGGMAEFDADSANTVVSDFERAIDAIYPLKKQGTHIGNALHEASDLLRRYGKPGNEQLIVLVSDGGDWVQPGVETTGEVADAYENPVLLMDHLHRALGIRVHTVGISTPDFFKQWLDEGNMNGVGLSPDHELLKELSRVGGGDAVVMGGLDVLVREFAELGAGTARRIRPGEQHAAAGALSRHTAEALLRLGERSAPVAARSATGAPATVNGAASPEALRDRILEAHGLVNAEARRIYGRPLLAVGHARKDVQRAVLQGDVYGKRWFVSDMTSDSFTPDLTGLPSPSPELRQPLTALNDFLDALRSAPEENQADGAWRAGQADRLAGLLQDLADRMAKAPEAVPLAAGDPGDLGGYTATVPNLPAAPAAPPTPSESERRQAEADTVIRDTGGTAGAPAVPAAPRPPAPPAPPVQPAPSGQPAPSAPSADSPYRDLEYWDAA